MTNNKNETIAAIATATGPGGIGVIRISGPDAVSILSKIFIPNIKKSKPTPYLLRFGRIVSHNGRQTLDEVLAVYMPGPKSYTGEDLVEIYCHAGQIVLKNILDNILIENCRPAEAGEFSMRRFVNHGTDLTRLEGMAQMVAAKTDLAYRFSRDHLLGGYGEYVGSLRDEIVRLLAEIEADIDFPDEDSVGTIGRDLLDKRLDQLIEKLEDLIESYRTGKIVRDGLKLILLGPPNSGKSSLFNRLVRKNRALVTPVPGTTRDYITEWIDVDGLPVELYDTAGLRAGRGKVEKAGIAGTIDIASGADIILYLVDLSKKRPILPGNNLPKDAKKIPIIIAGNKSDLIDDAESRFSEIKNKLGDRFQYILLSAKTGRGIKKLLATIYKMSRVTDSEGSHVVISHRHKNKLDNCLEHLIKVRKNSNEPPEIISFELRQSADQIGEITGSIYTEEILGEIFSNFCIGK